MIRLLGKIRNVFRMKIAEPVELAALQDTIDGLRHKLEIEQANHAETRLSLRKSEEENTILKLNVEQLIAVNARDLERVKAETAIASASYSKALAGDPGKK
jgi:hypothetical protein